MPDSVPIPPARLPRGLKRALEPSMTGKARLSRTHITDDPAGPTRPG